MGEQRSKNAENSYLTSSWKTQFHGNFYRQKIVKGLFSFWKKDAFLQNNKIGQKKYQSFREEGNWISDDAGNFLKQVVFWKREIAQADNIYESRSENIFVQKMDPFHYTYANNQDCLEMKRYIAKVTAWNWLMFTK